MTTSSTTMSRHSIAFLITTVFVLLLSSCNKGDVINKNDHHASSFSSEVLDKWMTVNLRLMRNATGIPNHSISRHFSYPGVAALQSLEPGLRGSGSWKNSWNGLTGLPESGHKKDYYYPANVNAAMASILRSFFPNANVADKATIDSLENALYNEFIATQDQSLVDNSVAFGRAVATAVYNWSQTDGHQGANAPYTPPTGTGLWKPTAPAFAPASTPYWGNNRPMILGSTDNTEPFAPVAYSDEPGSLFHDMVNEVYVVSQNLTAEQKAMAMFWRDVPGVTSPGHWLSILQQVVRKTGSSLEKAAVAYALTGAAINDALITCFKSKYTHSLVRPITYIREVMGHTTWTSFLGTPAHPEYISAHSSLSAAAASVLDKVFGDVGEFTDHTYDYMGFAPRSYSSMMAIGLEAGESRLYAGIHYRRSIDAGIVQGKKIAENIFK